MDNKILATVNGAPITTADVDAFLSGLGQRGQMYNNPEGRAIVLDQLINQKLFLIDAQRNLLEAEPAFQAQLKKLKESLLTNYAVEKLINPITVSDAEAKAYYDENPTAFVGKESVEASHILVDTEERAREIYAKIAGGELTFEEAAREYSSCPSKENGGSLGEFGRGQMVPEFDSAVFSMEVGTVTENPVQTQFGYHLIRLDKKSGGETMPYETVKASLSDKLLADKQQKAYESRVNQLKIVYPVDKML